MSNDEAAFLAAIAASPDDEAPRKVFADWLDEHGRDDEAAWQRAWTRKLAAKDWLMNYAMSNNNYDTPGEAFERLIEGLKSRELYFHGSDLHGHWELDMPDELKREAEIYLGIKIDWEGFKYSCSC